MNVETKLKELAEYTRIYEQAENIMNAIKEEIKQYMLENNLDTLESNEHKATYKEVSTSRIDTTALKKAFPAVAADFTRTSTSRRFIFK